MSRTAFPLPCLAGSTLLLVLESAVAALTRDVENSIR